MVFSYGAIVVECWLIKEVQKVLKYIQEKLKKYNEYKIT